MEDLNLPVFKGKLEAPRILSMDEYVKFVEFNREHFFNREVYEEWKRVSVIKVPFVIK